MTNGYPFHAWPLTSVSLTMVSGQEKKRIALYQLFASGNFEVNQLAQSTGLCVRSVKNHLQKFLQGGLSERQPGSGKTTKLNQEQVEALVALVQEHPEYPSRKLAAWCTNQFGFDVGYKAVIRTLKVNGFKSWKKKRVLKLTPINRENRLAWCVLHQDANFEDVWFSDESSFELYRAKNTYWALEQPTIETRGYSPKVGVWGAISARGKTELQFYTSSINSERYQEILVGVLIEEANTLYPEGWKLQQDNAPPHVSKVTKEWMVEHGVHALPWPPHSPDLNPIENVWALMKRNVEKKGPTTIEGLKTCIQEVWDAITLQDLQAYINSMTS